MLWKTQGGEELSCWLWECVTYSLLQGDIPEHKRQCGGSGCTSPESSSVLQNEGKVEPFSGRWQAGSTCVPWAGAEPASVQSKCSVGMLSFVIKTFFDVSVLQRTFLLRCFCFCFSSWGWRRTAGFWLVLAWLISFCWLKTRTFVLLETQAGVLSDTVFVYTGSFLQLYMAVSGYAEQVLQ